MVISSTKNIELDDVHHEHNFVKYRDGLKITLFFFQILARQIYQFKRIRIILFYA